MSKRRRKIDYKKQINDSDIQAVSTAYDRKKDECINSLIAKIDRYFKHVELEKWQFYDAESYINYCNESSRRLLAITNEHVLSGKGLRSFIYDHIGQEPEVVETKNRIRNEEDIAAIRHKSTKQAMVKKCIRNAMEQSGIVADCYKSVRAKYTPIRVAEIMASRKNASWLMREAYERLRDRDMMSREFIANTPDNYADFFPDARALKRHFILHIGPTNSGKTHEAMEELARAEYGIYLAPLRLLAYEQYERLTERGVSCAMITGEERILPENPTHQSSTIEIADFHKYWDVAVIDECQMIADSSRGGAWTNAILGICADKIHLCMSPDAQNCVIRMIESCGDTYEVKRHERMTPLYNDREPFVFPGDVQKGDALIVFSRRDVHAVAYDLMKKDISCSIIYGALPYEVRHREAKRFADGETKVVVSTDAIGMGMNLPIKRVVFLEVEKFDGNTRRELYSGEVKQIAGRAGRYGIYEKGYYTAAGTEEQLGFVIDAMRADESDIKKGVIGIPGSFFENDYRITDILTAWDELPATQMYDKGNIQEQIIVARTLEKIDNDRELVRRFINFAVDSEDEAAFPVLVSYYRDLVNGFDPDVYGDINRFHPEEYKADEAALHDLEGMYRVLDFLYAYSSAFEGDGDLLYAILEKKKAVSEKINEILGSNSFSARRCKVCNRRLPWNHPFGMCSECFKKRRGYHRRERVY